MRVPLSWLREFVEIEIPVETLAQRLSLAGIEVAKIEYIGKNSPNGEGLSWEKIYVGQLTDVRAHPNADRLTIAVIDYGKGCVESVTGAPNVRVGERGQKVAVAEVGAQLYEGHACEPHVFTVQATAVRGVTSQAVLCSEKELGLSEDHSGVLFLDAAAPIGVPLSDLMGDIVIELDLTPNYARCLSIIGVAREVAALTGRRIQISEPTWQAEGEPIEGKIELQIKDKDLCARYSAALIRGVKIGPSPAWLQHRLRLAGQRPINNIVDITNYVMLEWGQPLHAFDYDQLRPKKHRAVPAIVVRRAKAGEKLKTLDGVERELEEQMLLICDGQGPIALAGVMGGAESEVSETTVNILLESAHFQNTNNRRTSQKLQLMSEAAKRFTRGVPAETTVPAAMRAAELMRRLAGGTIAQGVADLYPVQRRPKTIALTATEVERILGMKIPSEQIVEVLERLDFTIQATSRSIKARPPYYRLDVEIEADVIEEIARVIGYDQIPTTRLADTLPPQRRNRSLELEQRAQDMLIAGGLTEVINYSLTNFESIAKLDPLQKPLDGSSYVRIANPLSREREVLRQTLMNGLLETVWANLRHTDRVAIFELGRVYLPKPSQVLPEEPRRLGIAMAGPRSERSWRAEAGELDFFDLKGVIESLLDALGIGEVFYKAEPHPTFHPGRCAQIYLGDDRVGVLGELHPLVRVQFDLPPKRICLAELDFERLIADVGGIRIYEKLPRFPSVDRDIAIVIEETVAAERIQRVLWQYGGVWLKRVSLFDHYKGEQIPAGKKSLAYALTYQAEDRTLTDEEVNQAHARIIQAVERELGAQVRAA